VLKKFASLILAVAMLLATLSFSGESLQAATPIRILIDNEAMRLDVDPIIQQGRVLVPFRALFEAFGATVGWDAATNTVTGQREGVSIVLVLNSRTARVNNIEVTLDVAPFATRGRTLVPLRFVAENLGADVSWDEATRTVIVVRPRAARQVRIAGNAHSQRVAQFANPDRFITPEELHALRQRNEQGIVVIGVLNPTLAIIPLNPARSPIEGSFSVWRPDYSGTGSVHAVTPGVSGMAFSREVMEGLLSRAGATPQSMIVVYALDNFHDAARFVWQIQQLGHQDVRYLDGGLNAWQAARFPTGNFARLAEQPLQARYVAPSFDPSRGNASLQGVLNALNIPSEWVVIDTRSADEFAGRNTASSRGAFGVGRIRGTVHIDWVNANAADRTLKSRAEMAAIYNEHIRGRRVIVFCQSGVRSSHTLMVLRDVLGVANVFNFDGSWIEWSFVASEVSAGQVPEALQRQVRDWTELWNDHRGEIR